MNESRLEMEFKDVKQLNESLKDSVKQYVDKKSGELLLDVLYVYCYHLVKLKLLSQEKLDKLMQGSRRPDFLFSCKVFLDMTDK